MAVLRAAFWRQGPSKWLERRLFPPEWKCVMVAADETETPMVDDFLAAYPSEISALARLARSLILDVIPDTIEQVDTSAKLIGYGYDRGYTGLICGIALQTSYVNLMFSRGTELPDPDGLLEGTGKKARHVKIRTGGDLHKPAVRALLHAAAAATKQGMEAKKKRKG